MTWMFYLAGACALLVALVFAFKRAVRWVCELLAEWVMGEL